MAWQRWITVGIVLGLLLLLFALLMPAAYQAREAARRTNSKNNLRQIGLAVLNYHDANASLPSGGIIREDDAAMQGWMTMILPYLDASPFYSWLDLNESWQSLRNAFVFGQSRPVYLIPGINEHYTATGFGLTDYLGNPNLLHRNSGVTFAQMENGTAHTWLVGEVAGNIQPWAYPFNWRPLGTRLCDGPDSYGRPEWNGGHLLFADGSVSFFSDQTSPDILKRFAAAPPVATEEQTAVPEQVFQTGDFFWERIELESDSESKRDYFCKSLENSQGELLVIQVFAVEKEIEPPLYKGGPAPQGLLRIDSSTDITSALKATPLADATSPAQFEANVKLLKSFQKQLK